MITNLHIKNIGIIDDLNLELNNGFNVLTGETGAGKTLIIDSLGIICGGRFSKEMIRKGETQSFVELCIYDPTSEYSVDGNIIVSREIYENGRNLCKINGRLITVNELKKIMNNFIEIHGQNDNQNLLDNKTHLKYLDNFVGEELQEISEKYKENYQRRNEIIKELKENYGDDKEKQRKLDLLRYQLNEIEDAKLKENEEIELEEKRKIFLNSEKISENLNKANVLIGDNSVDTISEAIRALEKIETIDEKYEKVTSNLKSIYYELQEISRDISIYNEDTYFDQNEQEEIENRLDLIFSLKRKYGNNIKEILNYKNQIEEEIKYIENLEENNEKLKIKLKKLEEETTQIAEKIHNLRNKKATKLSQCINKELEELEMKNAKINVKVEYIENDFFETGKDKVEFYIKTNMGEEEKELNKIASGGEMSRIMLAIKKVLAETDKTPILIFDEIDTGISGKAGSSVADKLKSISNNHQVLCISHLPTIAASANYNYYISKQVENKRTRTTVKLLNENEVINEIARISSGEVNDITIKYALELRNKKSA